MNTCNKKELVTNTVDSNQTISHHFKCEGNVCLAWRWTVLSISLKTQVLGALPSSVPFVFFSIVVIECFQELFLKSVSLSSFHSCMFVNMFGRETALYITLVFACPWAVTLACVCVKVVSTLL